MAYKRARTPAVQALGAPSLEHPPDEDANGECQNAGADDNGGYVGRMVGVLGMPDHAIAAAVGAESCADQVVSAPGRCPPL